jgi:alkaline phosphatase D
MKTLYLFLCFGCAFGTLLAPAQSVYEPAIAPFYHGVASGDPLPDAVILWTRITPSNAPATIPLLWQVATDTTFEHIVRYGYGNTTPNIDYTFKVDADGLQPDTYYFYRFYALGKYSMVGRTQTAPAETTENTQVRLAITSCAEFADGYFTPYRKIAQRNDIDAVVQLGDYIYERSGSDIRAFDPDDELVSLAQYRTRHSQYKLDSDLRAAHQRYPFIVIWDDHEFANNAYRDNAGGHNSLFEGSWESRKAAATQAYYEWQPIRLPDPNANPQRIYRRLGFGSLVDLLLLDTRIIGRDQQAFAFVGADDSDRTILGSSQREWLLNALSGSVAHWKIIGQQVMFAPFRIAGARVNNDQWDGYTADRQRILDHIVQQNITNTVVLTGDIHSAWANDVPYNNYNPATGEGSATVEFITPSITSDGFPFEFGQDVILDDNSHVKYNNLLGKGYIVLDITPNQVQADYYFVNTISAPTSSQYFETAYRVIDQTRYLQTASSPTLSTETAAVLPADALSPDVVKLQLRLFLEGATQDNNMTTFLLQNNLLPLNQPFNAAPWDYAGTESVPNAAFFPTNTVDWVLVELLDTSNTQTVLYRTAALLLADGRVTSLREGSSSVWIPNLVPYQQSCKVAVRTRNHLAVISSQNILLPNATVYDFGEAAERALGIAQQTHPTALWQLWAGDINQDGVINYGDYNVWKTQSSNNSAGYRSGDVNLDGYVDANDFSFWRANARQIGIAEIR